MSVLFLFRLRILALSNFNSTRSICLSSSSVGQFVLPCSAPAYWPCSAPTCHSFQFRDRSVAHEQIDAVCRFLWRDTNTPFAFFVDLRIFLRANTEPLMPTVHWALPLDGEENWTRLTYNGTQITFSKLQETYKFGLAETLGRFRDEVTRGCTFPAQVGLLLDDVRNTSVGWSVASIVDRDGSGEARSILADHLASSGQMAVLQHGELVWNPEKLRVWLRHVETFLLNLAVLVHISAPGPNRGTELTATLLSNSATQKRHLFGLVQTLCTVNTYSKNSWRVGASSVYSIRFLPHDVAQLLFLYVTYVRPVELIAADVLWTSQGNPEPARLYNHVLFVLQGTHLSSERLSNALQRSFLNFGGVDGIRLSAYRQISAAFAEKFITLDKSANHGFEAVAVMSGHTSRTAVQHYARTTLDAVGEVDRITMVEAYDICVQWQHRLIGATPSVSQRAFLSHSSSVVSHSAAGSHSAVITTSGSAPASSNDSWSLGERRVLPLPVVESKGEQDAGSAQLLQVVPSHRREDTNNLWDSVRPRALSSSSFYDATMEGTLLLNALRKLLDDRQARFRPGQSGAVTAVLRRQEDLLIILPTGQGKSTLWLLPTIIEPPTTCTLIVAPTKALKAQILAQCQKLGISLSAYKGADRESPLTFGDLGRLCLVQVEQLDHHFVRWANHLAAQGHIARIIIEECHVALYWQTFRPAMQRFSDLRVLAMPIVCITATLPPELEPTFQMQLGVKLRCIRSPTTSRANLRYCVQHMDSEADVDAEIGRILEQRLSGSSSQRAIVFCRSKRATEHLHEYLSEQGLSSSVFHSELGFEESATALQALHSGAVTVMCATSGLGIGVDVPSVDTVIHKGPAYTRVSLVQEGGRAGRSNSGSEALVQTVTCRSLELPLVPDELAQRVVPWAIRGMDSTQHVVAWLHARGCRRKALFDFVDGGDADTCLLFAGGCSLCDWCEQQQTWADAGYPQSNGTHCLLIRIYTFWSCYRIRIGSRYRTCTYWHLTRTTQFTNYLPYSCFVRRRLSDSFHVFSTDNRRRPNIPHR